MNRIFKRYFIHVLLSYHSRVFSSTRRFIQPIMASSEPRDLEQVVRDGLSTLVFGFGYRVGIVDAFNKIKQPCTAEELAMKVNMKKR